MQEQQQRIEDLEAQINTTDTTTTPTDTTITQDGTPCPGTPTVTDYDGNVYNTVKIGEQCWMKENLRTTHYADGSELYEDESDLLLADTTDISTTAAFYYTTSRSVEYGYFYDWLTVVRNSNGSSSNPSGVQGICPIGWHVPSDAEWYQLTDYVGGQSQYNCDGNSSYIAKALAAQTGWNSSTATCAPGDEPSNNNATGFDALPAGLHLCGQIFDSGYGISFWSSTKDTNSSLAWCRFLHYNNANVIRLSDIEMCACSVRCLRD